MRDALQEDVRTVLLAGGEGRRMGLLGQGRSKPLVPFGGSCRLIDFSLANAAASGLSQVLLLPQYEERQLMDDLRRTWWRTGFRVHFGPYDEFYRAGVPDDLPRLDLRAERGTADAFINKAPYVFDPGVRDVLILHADHVYRYDYTEMVEQHRRSGAALTIAYQRIDRRYVHLFGMVEFDGDGRLTGFVEKPTLVTSDLVFAAFCVFSAEALHRYLSILDGTDWQHDISRDVIPAMLAQGELVRGHHVEGYWADIGTLDRYHEAHLLMVSGTSSRRPDLAAMPRTIRPGVPRHFVEQAEGVCRTVVAADLRNDGTVQESVLFPGVTVGKGACVRRSVVLPGATVAAGAHVHDALVLEDGAVQQLDPVPPVTAGGT